jgi:hypothetical protein
MSSNFIIEEQRTIQKKKITDTLCGSGKIDSKVKITPVLFQKNSFHSNKNWDP